MVAVLSGQLADMNGHAGAAGQSDEELLCQLGVKGAHLLGGVGAREQMDIFLAKVREILKEAD